MTTRFNIGFAYFLLVPGLGLFYIALLILGDIRIWGFELGDLRPFGAPSLANLIEIPIAAAVGIVSAVGLAIMRKAGRIHRRQSISRWVLATYGLAMMFYILMPGLPE